ncbi:hypothetical protein LJC25_05080 [Bacteroidales bacterium OttesenSCG-928-K03]|nr:hypothetical protein [Odoribacter sp. OttesenSCG-928-L07]MDL2243083.1 hypothetical protein [Bacteroidales bacterium OttesenSCG-928-K03]
MKKFDYSLTPKVGIGNIKFGTTLEEVIKILGEADEMEEFNDEDFFNTTLLTYSELELDLFFEGSDKLVFSAIGVDNDESTLYGKKIFEMDEAGVIKLMKDNGFKEVDINVDEEYDEKCVSFEDANFDFYFNNEGNLVSVNFGVLVSEEGNIIDFD